MKRKKAIILALSKRELPALPGPADTMAESDCLLNRAGHVGENVVRIRPNQPDRAYHDYEDDGQHYRIFRYVLSFFLAPKSPEMIHFPPLLILKSSFCDSLKAGQKPVASEG